MPPAPAEASLRSTRFSPREVIASAASLWWAHAVPISLVAVLFSIPQALQYFLQAAPGSGPPGTTPWTLPLSLAILLASRMRAAATTAGALEASGGALLALPALVLTGWKQALRMTRVGLRCYWLAFLVAAVAAATAIIAMRPIVGSERAGYIGSLVAWWCGLPFAAPVVGADAIALLRPGASPRDVTAEARALARGRQARLMLVLAATFPLYAIPVFSYHTAKLLDPELGAFVGLASAGVNAVAVGFLNVLCVVAYRALEREEKGVGSGELAAVFD